MGFHITQPGSSVATSLIDGEAKPKHVLLLEINVNMCPKITDLIKISNEELQTSFKNLFKAK